MISLPISFIRFTTAGILSIFSKVRQYKYSRRVGIMDLLVRDYESLNLNPEKIKKVFVDKFLL